VPNVVGSTEQWALYIVPGGVMVGFPNITPPVTVYSFYPSLLPTTMGTYLNRIMFDSLMMAF
jgi:hypothetical protein